jgi:hypothetical protein
VYEIILQPSRVVNRLLILVVKAEQRLWLVDPEGDSSDHLCIMEAKGLVRSPSIISDVPHKDFLSDHLSQQWQPNMDSCLRSFFCLAGAGGFEYPLLGLPKRKS